MAKSESLAAKFQIFRAADAPSLMESGCMTFDPAFFAEVAKRDTAALAASYEGEEIRVLCQMPGFALTHVWFKPGYQLPLHSHDADCMYFIISGALRLGTEDLGPRDCFFIPSNVPYTYKIGDDGVELLEIRHQPSFNFVNHTHGDAWWDKAAAKVLEAREGWKDAKRPVLNG